MYKDVFAWKDVKGIPLELAHHRTKVDTSIPPTHQAKFRMNPNYVVDVKQDIDKLLATIFIKPVEEAIWMSPITIIFKKNINKFKILCRLQKTKCIYQERSISIAFYI